MTTTPPEIPAYNGCVWPMDPACQTEEWDAYEPETQERALRLASSTLYRLSGFRVTNCPITVRPGPQRSACDGPLYGNLGVYGSARLGGVVNTRAGDHRRVRLPDPIGRVDMVRIGMEILSPEDYRVERNYLVRLDGLGWPQNPDMYSPLGSPNTWSVTYINGHPVDSNAAYAVGLLALEFAKACSGKKCGLPPGVTSIARQGISMEIATGVFVDGFTGIRAVDAWIGLWNPRGMTHPPKVYSPDLADVVVVAAPVIP